MNKDVVILERHVHMDMPFTPAAVKLSNLRPLVERYLEQTKCTYPDFITQVHMSLACDESQRFEASCLPGFIPASRMRDARREDFGRCERFRFTWKHIADPGGRRNSGAVGYIGPLRRRTDMTPEEVTP